MTSIALRERFHKRIKGKSGYYNQNLIDTDALSWYI